MTPAQRAAVSYLARYSGHTHALYAYQLRRWFAWCETNGLDPLVGIQRAHIELYIRYLGESGLMASSVTTSMHAVRGFFGSPTSTVSSSRTPPSTHAFPGCTATSPVPRAWTGSS
jgi:site-specific recombinase XerD